MGGGEWEGAWVGEGGSGKGGGEEEEEEERQQRSHVRWAAASSPGGPTQTSRGSPLSYLRQSKTNLAAHLRALRPCQSAGVQRPYGPILRPDPCHQP